MNGNALPEKGTPRVTREKPCASCGCLLFDVEPPKGPHGHHLRCSNCGRGGYWMKKAESGRLFGGEAA